jgi:hypothetical protein
MNKLQFILMSKLKSPAKDYEQAVSKGYIEHNIKANENGYKAVLEAVKRGQTEISFVFEEAYKNTPISRDLKKLIKDKTSQYYRYRKQKNAIRFRSLKKADVSYTLNMLDKETINILGQSDILWIKGHAVRTLVSTEIEFIMRDAIREGMSGDAIAAELTSWFQGFSPEKYTEMFGEQKYWEMVTNTNQTRITAFNDLNFYEEMEVTAYKIDTRGALACEICAPYEGKIYEVSQAANKRDLYLEMAKNEDTDGMKNVFTFGQSNVEGIGEVPPFHPNCYCEILPVLD